MKPKSQHSRPPRTEAEQERRRLQYRLERSSRPERYGRPLCPVCGYPIYSRASVHPQCAFLREAR
jgi:hypothetical protein